MSELNDNMTAEIEEKEKSTIIEDKTIIDNSVGDITFEQFKNSLDNNLEIKGYYDSFIDKTVNKRLDKSIEAWKNKNLENIINEEINKRYPQKTETEIKFEEQQKELEKAIQEKKQLELQIKYQSLMAENNLPMEILDFVAGNDIEATITNIERFKTLTDKYVSTSVENEVIRRLGNSMYVPPENDVVTSGSMWE